METDIAAKLYLDTDGVFSAARVSRWSTSGGRWLLRDGVVWVDDDAISARARTWADGQQSYRYLLVEPQANRGLSPGAVRRIAEWLAET